MTRIAITGHRGLPDRTTAHVDRELRRIVASTTDLTGLSCLADGADQLFARGVIDAGGVLEVIVPAQRYRDGLPATAQAGYDEVFAHAAAVHHMGVRGLHVGSRSRTSTRSKPRRTTSCR